jgi:hypothetical protein
MVGVSDYLPNTIWVTHFMRAQGYPPSENFLEQDNESAIKLEVNGRTSAGAKSRHLDIRYFWIKENLETMGIRVRHCRTLQMLGDFFTKPQQGTLFRVMRDVLLGKLPIRAIELLLDRYPIHSVEERVGDMRQNGQNTDDKENIRQITQTEQQNIREQQNIKQKDTTDVDGFTIVKGKAKHTKNNVDGYMSPWSGEKLKKNKRIVSWSLT